MALSRVRWLSRFLKETASWAVFLWGIAIGFLGTALCAGSSATLSSKADWSGLVGFILFGLIPLLASILGLGSRKQAAYLFLAAAVLVAVAFVAATLMRRDVSLESALAIAGVTSILFLPGLFWLMTKRWEWGPLVTRRASVAGSARQPVLFNASLVLALVLASAFASLYLPFDFNCYKGGRPVSVQTSPRHTVFTGRVLALGHPLQSRGCPWALLRVEHIYWGLPRWMSRMVFVRGYFRETDKGQEYFVDAHRSSGVLTRFLPVVEFYRCCHTNLLSDAEVDLRVIQDGPPKSGVRIIGRVYRVLRGGDVPGVPVTVIGPNGSVSSVTDGHGIYDMRDLLPGHYSIRVGSREHQADLKAGDVWDEYFWIPNESPVQSAR